MRFDEFDLNYDVLDALDAMHFEECTPIQEQAIPAVLDGRDLIAVAQTGTGKTAAYLLPVISELSDGDFPTDAVNCIVMAPTRELAMQIDRQLEGFSYFLSVSSLPIYGGTDGATFAQQQKGLKLGADVVIATPGRLLAHLQMGYVDLSKVSFFILDEADRMLDMGFYDDIMQIVKHLPKERQTLMFSATMPPKIQQLANTILNDPAEIKIAVSKPADKIDQSAYVCYEPQKLPILKHLFATMHSNRVIVFASSKLKVKELSRELRRSKYKIGEMHSDLEQAKRDEVMLAFKAGRIDVLVATDIVARGIDIEDISMVVNYDVPHDAEDYVHRIGRTARAQADGTAVTLISERDQLKFGQIERFLEKEVRKNPIPEGIGEAPQYRPDRKNHGQRRNNQRGRANRNRTDGRSSNNRKHSQKPGIQEQPKDIRHTSRSKSNNRQHRRRPKKDAEN
ncbi:MAG: DEAD/DEAH box helicase [Muribaculaceae bacterium]|nr:DEAD/DEAH box helicase [Muribaculaceae bacterium]